MVLLRWAAKLHHYCSKGKGEKISRYQEDISFPKGKGSRTEIRTERSLNRYCHMKKRLNIERLIKFITYY